MTITLDVSTLKLRDEGGYYTLRAPRGLVLSTECLAPKTSKEDQLAVVRSLLNNLEMLS